MDEAIGFAWANSAKAGISADKTAPTIKASECGYPAVVYDGSSVTSPKNWNNPKPEDPCYSLHTDSRNYVVISLQGAGRTSSGQQGGDGYNSCGLSYTLNTVDVHGVCYGLSRSILKGGENAGGIPIGDNVQPAMTANGCGAVCYEEVNDEGTSRKNGSIMCE